MDRSAAGYLSALERLPRAYRIALRLHDLGAEPNLIADCLEIDPTAVPTLLYIAMRKLDTAADALRRDLPKPEAKIE